MGNPLASEGPWAFLRDVSAFPASHLILPFTMHLLFPNAWMVLCACYLYESFEAVLDVEFTQKGKRVPIVAGWEGAPEPQLDQMVSDPCMAILGLLLATGLRDFFERTFSSEETTNVEDDEHERRPPSLKKKKKEVDGEKSSEAGIVPLRLLFPNATGGVVRRTLLFLGFALPSFFLLNWDPTLEGRRMVKDAPAEVGSSSGGAAGGEHSEGFHGGEGWSTEDPLPPHGFRVGDAIFASNYLLMVGVCFFLQCPEKTRTRRGLWIYGSWALVAFSLLAAGCVGGGPLFFPGTTTYERLGATCAVFLLIYLGKRGQDLLRKVKKERNGSSFSRLPGEVACEEEKSKHVKGSPVKIPTKAAKTTTGKNLPRQVSCDPETDVERPEDSLREIRIAMCGREISTSSSLLGEENRLPEDDVVSDDLVIEDDLLSSSDDLEEVVL